VRFYIKIAILLAIVSFPVFTIWWYAIPVDGVDTIYWGFPFPYIGEGWHTSGAMQ